MMSAGSTGARLAPFTSSRRGRGGGRGGWWSARELESLRLAPIRGWLAMAVHIPALVPPFCRSSATVGRRVATRELT